MKKSYDLKKSDWKQNPYIKKLKKETKSLKVSIKSSHEFFEGLSKAFKAVSKKKVAGTHYKVSFDNKKDFNKFVKKIIKFYK